MNEEKTLINLKGISKTFDGESVLNNIDLFIRDGEFVTLLGPSGCGKTTTLRIIAGFENPDSGEILFEDKSINGVPAYKRQVNTIFQRYALFPHLNVYENIAFGLKVKKTPDSEIKEKVSEMLTLVNLNGMEKRNISKLSGGQQQRVAIARALINHPKVLLLDEPLSALDLKLRKDMQTELKNIQKSLGITFIFVTHDQEEALALSDIVVVMNEGEIQQIGTPEDIYNEPKNAFVANFIGESNILEGIMLKDNLVKFFKQEFECVDKGFDKNEPVDVVIRPEDIEIVPESESNLTGIVSSVTFKGVHYEVIVDISGFKWMIQSTKCSEVGDKIGIKFSPENIHVMKKSVYSGMYGDYSSFSDEYERLDEIIEDDVEEELE